MRRAKLIIPVIAIVIVVIIGVLASMYADDGGMEREEKLFEESENSQTESEKPTGAPENPDNPPNNLQLPFKTSDINENRGGVNPLGVVRFSKDLPELGHSGIDIPLNQGAPIFAVADGPIVIIKSAGDPWGGMGISQLLEPTIPGEGWIYIYEHITPVKGIEAGSKVNTGDLIATKTAPAGFTAHFQLSYAFNNYKFNRGMECWVDFLGRADKSTLLDWWQARITSGKVAVNWTGPITEGTAPFEGLLDTAKYPNGPQLCYPPGTDVR